MGVFDFLTTDTTSEQRDPVDSLTEIVGYSGNDEVHTRENMDRVISSIEQNITNKSPLLLYWLGLAWRNYTTWHIRGDERKQYLLKAVNYLQRSLDKASEANLPVRLPQRDRNWAKNLDQITIASKLAQLLVDEAIIRDLDRAEPILKFIADSTDDYEPVFCSYAELYYKRKNYKKCYRVAMNVHKRALNSEEWGSDPPPAPLSIAGKALRVLVRKAKKNDNYREALKYAEKLDDLGVGTDNDKKILSKLRKKTSNN